VKRALSHGLLSFLSLRFYSFLCQCRTGPLKSLSSGRIRLPWRPSAICSRHFHPPISNPSSADFQSHPLRTPLFLIISPSHSILQYAQCGPPAPSSASASSPASTNPNSKKSSGPTTAKSAP
ncbi:hypothetical protein B0J18DRAFT_293866, partial [Chaetomium sp. MPI-SDFR-AT-0129]